MAQKTYDVTSKKTLIEAISAMDKNQMEEALIDIASDLVLDEDGNYEPADRPADYCEQDFVQDVIGTFHRFGVGL